jgi:hypothetical protein
MKIEGISGKIYIPGGLSMRSNSKKFLLLLVVAAIIVIVIVVAGRAMTKLNVSVAEQFTVIDQVPYLVKDGDLYEYSGNRWSRVEQDGNVSQLVSGEVLCGLDTDGNVFYDGSTDITDDMPLGSASDFQLAQQLIACNESEKFLCIGDTITLSCLALPEDGTILYPDGDTYARFQMDEVPVFLSGNYILTERGNVYYLNLENEVGDTPQLVSVYDGENIVSISSCYSDQQCIGLKDDGSVCSWSANSDGSELPVSDWTQVISVKQGFHFAVGLTGDGKVLYAGSGVDQAERIENELSQWNDIVQIAIYGTAIYGLKSDGSCLTIQ